MPTKPADSPSAVDEAIRTLAEASTPVISRRLFRAWASGMEALMTASVDVQNAWLAISRPMLETTFNAQKSVLAALTSAVEQQQQATLTFFRRMAEDTEKVLEPSD